MLGRYSKFPFVCFIHVEKVAGMTMHQILHRNVPGYISPHPGFGEYLTAAELKKLKKWWPQRISGIGGHRMAPFLDYENVVSKPVFYFSIVRDPIKRYVSTLNWKVHIMKQGWTPESYGEEPLYNNFQCFRIAGKRSFEAAKKVIQNDFSIIGLIDHFNESLLFLKNELNIPGLDFRYEKDNVKNYGEDTISWEDLKPEIKEQYIQNNAEDQKLYEFVKNELWPNYRANYQGDLAQDLVQFEEQLKRYKKKPWHYFKQKGSNYLLGRVWQPMLFGPQKQVS